MFPNVLFFLLHLFTSQRNFISAFVAKIISAVSFS